MSPSKSERSRKAVKSPRVKQEANETKVKLDPSRESDDDLDEVKSPIKKKLHLDNITKLETDIVDEKLLAEDAEQPEHMQDDEEKENGEGPEHIPLDLDEPDHLRYSLVQPQHVPHLSIEELKESKHAHRLRKIASLIASKHTDEETLHTIANIVIDSGNYGELSDSYNFDLCNLDKQAIHKISISLNLEQADEII